MVEQTEEIQALRDQVRELSKQNLQILDSLNQLAQTVINLVNRVIPPERALQGTHVAFWRLDPDGNIWSAGMLRVEDWEAFSASDPTARLVYGPCSEEQAALAAEKFETLGNERVGNA